MKSGSNLSLLSITRSNMFQRICGVNELQAWAIYMRDKVMGGESDKTENDDVRMSEINRTEG